MKEPEIITLKLYTGKKTSYKEEYFKFDFFDFEGNQLIFPKLLAKDLEQLTYEMVKEEMDIFLVLDGKVGIGKSHALRQIAWVINYYLKKHWNIEKNITLDNIHYSVDDYIESSYKTESIGHLNVLDEGGDELDRGAATSFQAKRFVRYLRKCRKLQQIHLLAMPKCHHFIKYIALERFDFFIHMEKWREKNAKSPTGLSLAKGNYRVIRADQRWTFCYLDKGEKYPRFLFKNRNIKEKKDNGYNDTVKYYADQRARFFKCEVITKDMLKELKRKNIEYAKEVDMVTQDKKTTNKKDVVLNLRREFPTLSNKKIGELACCDSSYVSKISNKQMTD